MTTGVTRKPDEIRAMIEAADQVAVIVGGEAFIMPRDQALRILAHFEGRRDFRLACVRCPEDPVPFLLQEYLQ